MWSRAGAVAIVLALPGTPGLAASCEAEIEAAKLLLDAQGFSLIEAGALSSDGDTCTLGGAVFAQPETVFVPIDEIVWTATGYDGLDLDPPAPMRFEITVTGARISAQTGTAWTDWMLREQSRRSRTDITAALSWSPADGVLSVETLDIDMPGENRVTLSSEVTGASLATLAGGQSELSSLSATRLSLAIENAGFLDGLFLGQMVAVLSTLPGSPDAIVASTLEEMQGFVDGWPEPIFPPESRAALKSLIADGPVPWGRLEIGLAEGTGLAVATLVEGFAAGPAFSPEALAASFEGAVFDITYTPRPDGE